MREARRLRWAWPVLLVGPVVLAGAGGAPPIPPAPKVPVGTTYVRHDDFSMDLAYVSHAILGGQHVRSRSHYDDVIRGRILAVADGFPSRLELTFVKVNDPDGLVPALDRLAGRTFVLTRGRGALDPPTVTEKGVRVTGKEIWLVINDGLDALLPKALIRESRVINGHVGVREPVPVDTLERFRGPDSGRRIVSFAMELRRVAGGRGYLRCWEHDHRDKHLSTDIHTTSDAVLDAATGETLSVLFIGTVKGHGWRMTWGGPMRIQVTGKQVLSETFTWHRPGSSQ